MVTPTNEHHIRWVLLTLAQGNCISDEDWRLLQRELHARTIAHAVAIGYQRGLLRVRP